jgi:hypothetical protein
VLLVINCFAVIPGFAVAKQFYRLPIQFSSFKTSSMSLALVQKNVYFRFLSGVEERLKAKAGISVELVNER